jgi:hypothetical protein
VVYSKLETGHTVERVAMPVSTKVKNSIRNFPESFIRSLVIGEFQDDFP